MIWIKRIIVLLISTIVIYILSITFFVLSPDIDDFFNRTDFDSEVWVNWVETESNLKDRWNMIHDLTEKYKLKGMQKEEIKKLLGTPSSEYENEISYYLGMTGHGINTGSLNLKFKNGIVIDYNVHQG
jgi:hypothetical protein